MPAPEADRCSSRASSAEMTAMFEAIEQLLLELGSGDSVPIPCESELELALDMWLLLLWLLLSLPLLLLLPLPLLLLLSSSWAGKGEDKGDGEGVCCRMLALGRCGGRREDSVLGLLRRFFLLRLRLPIAPSLLFVLLL